MIAYANRGGDSGVTAYQKGPDYIRVRFSSGAEYLYTNASAGAGNIRQMKLLADSGIGLNAFINHYVKFLYVK